MSLSSNIHRPRIFFDASALFSAVFSSTGGARLILQLGESQVVDLVISSQVLAEAEGALRRKAPEVLGHLAVLLDRARFQVMANAPMDQVNAWLSVIPYQPDAAVLAAAVASRADYLVTLDRQHFLENARLMASPPLPIGTPGDFVGWLRDTL